jgi:hypothetical protein
LSSSRSTAGLLVAIADPQALEEAAQELAMVEMDGEVAEGQVLEDRRDHRRDLRVEARRQRVLADHVDIALVELAVPPALRPLAAVHPLHLVAAEGKGELVFMFGDIARQRDREVEAQRQFRAAASPSAPDLLSSAPVDCTKYTWRSVSPPDLVRSTSESSITGVSTGRNPNCSKVRRIVSSMRWKAIWSRGNSSMTPDGVRGLIGILKLGLRWVAGAAQPGHPEGR